MALAISEHGDRIAEEVLAPRWDLEETVPDATDGWHLLATDLGAAAVWIAPAAG